MRWLAPALVLVAVLVLGAPALASNVSVSGDTITLADPGAETNYVVVNHGNNSSAVANVRDNAGIVPVPPCFEAFTGVVCPTQARPTYVLNLGGANDFAQTINLMAAGTHTEMLGGDGNDQLWSYEGSDTLDGGAGDDELIPDHENASPGDVLRGGAGKDHLQLAPVTVSELRATLDGKADDGGPGEKDNYASDIERVTGSQTGRNRIVGSSVANAIDGQEQADRLAGGGGEDELDGRGGPDVIDALDGAGGDRVDCGEGADAAFADAKDVIARDTCEKLTWAPSVSSSRLRYGSKRIAVRLKCPRASRRGCSGNLRLTTRGGKRIANGSYRIGRGKAVTVRLRASKKPARQGTLYVAPKGSRPVAGRRVSVR